jgi:hypothetical protein
MDCRDHKQSPCRPPMPSTHQRHQAGHFPTSKCSRHTNSAVGKHSTGFCTNDHAMQGTAVRAHGAKCKIVVLAQVVQCTSSCFWSGDFDAKPHFCSHIDALVKLGLEQPENHLTPATATAMETSSPQFEALPAQKKFIWTSCS